MQTPSPLVRRLVSIAILCHFALIWIAYSSNWRRSGVQDKLLTVTQPYHIGLNLGFEMLPIEWGRAPEFDVPTRMVLSDARAIDTPVIVLDSTARTHDRSKMRQFLELLVTSIDMFDDETVTKLLSSSVHHFDMQTANGTPSSSFNVVSIERKPAPHSDYEATYRASIVREEGSLPRFLPTLAPSRTMKAITEVENSDQQTRQSDLDGAAR